MAQEIDEMCIDNLDEFIYDENKLVTYKWLSRSLSMHVNQAKHALYVFVNKKRNEADKDDLYLTYLVAGMVKDGDTMVYKVHIVCEESLESTKSTLDVLTSCHIYSVKKGKLKDVNSLYAADYDQMKANILQSNQHSAISCPAAKLLSEQSVDQNRSKMVAKKPDAKPKENAPSKKPEKPAEKVSPKGKKPAGIVGMFAKSSAKSDTSKPHETNKSEKDTNSKGKTKPKQGGMMNFFSKQAGKPKQESKNEEEISGKNKEMKKEEKEETISEVKKETEKSPEPEKESTEEKVKPKEEITKKESKKETKPTESKPEKKDNNRGKKNKSDSDHGGRQQKKRRRIKQQFSDSSEDEMDVEVESPIPSPAPPESDSEEIPPTPSPKKSKKTPLPSPPKATKEEEEISGKVKKRKLVSKTFVNDEGFMVTEKVYEDEWEDAPAAKKPATEEKSSTKTQKKSSESPPKKKSPTKPSGKQSNMMSFFKKK